MDDMEGRQSDGLLVAEGDSWLKLVGPDLEDALKKNGYTVESGAQPGDTLENMTTDEEIDRLKNRLYQVKAPPRR